MRGKWVRVGLYRTEYLGDVTSSMVRMRAEDREGRRMMMQRGHRKMLMLKYVLGNKGSSIKEVMWNLTTVTLLKVLTAKEGIATCYCIITTAHHLYQSHHSECPAVSAAIFDADSAFSLHRYCVSFVRMWVSADCCTVRPWQLSPCLLQRDTG